MSRRGLITMDDAELKAFLDERDTMIVTTLGAHGRPHSMPLWYIVRDGEPWVFTYGSSQKVRNLERDPRATLLIESGVEYEQLRGLVLYADATIHAEPEIVTGVAEELIQRYSDRGQAGRSGLSEPNQRAVRATVGKRVAVRFRVERVVSWDHTKLAGTY